MYSIDVCVDAKRCSEGNLDKFIRETAYELNCSNCYMTYEQTEKKIKEKSGKEKNRGEMKRKERGRKEEERTWKE